MVPPLPVRQFVLIRLFPFCVKKGATKSESKFENRVLVGFIDGGSDSTAHLDPRFVHTFNCTNAVTNPIDPTHPFRDTLIDARKEATENMLQISVATKKMTIGKF